MVTLPSKREGKKKGRERGPEKKKEEKGGKKGEENDRSALCNVFQQTISMSARCRREEKRKERGSLAEEKGKEEGGKGHTSRSSCAQTPPLTHFWTASLGQVEEKRGERKRRKEKEWKVGQASVFLTLII